MRTVPLLILLSCLLLLSACSSEKCIPAIWKTANVVALHKKGSVHNLNEYRPVSLTCIMCTVYEKLIREYILDGIEAVLNDKQHGLVRGRSCLSNLLETQFKDLFLVVLRPWVLYT